MIITELLHHSSNPNNGGGYDKIPLVSIFLSVLMFVPIDIAFKILVSLVIIFGNIPNILKSYDTLRERFKKNKTKDDTNSQDSQPKDK